MIDMTLLMQEAMPMNFVSELKWLIKLFKRRGHIVRRKREDGYYEYSQRIPYPDGAPPDLEGGWELFQTVEVEPEDE